MAEGKQEVRIVELRGERFIHQTDIIYLILQLVPAMTDPDDRRMVKQLAENISNGTVR